MYNDLPDRSPGLARVHACAKEARGWGWALRLAEGKHLFVPRSWRRCNPTTRAFLQGIVKDRAVGYGGMVSPLYRKFLFNLKCNRNAFVTVPNHSYTQVFESLNLEYLSPSHANVECYVHIVCQITWSLNNMSHHHCSNP
jgi:hypothetical protein